MRPAGALGALLLLCSGVAAQPMPFSDGPVRGREDALVVERLGSPDTRAEGLSARRASARRRGLERAKRALHAHVDQWLAAALATPALASRVHAVVERDAQVEATRSLVDGAVVLRVALALGPLRALLGREAS
ncbi:MAG: hypothetical protein AAF447_15485 [Myxococcota bacterium]